MLKPYFESKIGQKIKKKLVTGETLFTEVYARMYSFEVIWVTEEKVCLLMKSDDLVPSGYINSGSDRVYGEVVVEIENEESLEKLLMSIIEKKDKLFIQKYFA